MKRVLMYKGKTIQEMTLNELENQFKMNKLRMIYRTFFFVLIAISVLFYDILACILPILLAVITGYWLIENNNEIINEINSREAL